MIGRLSINNLPHYITGKQLETLFAEAGSVILAKVIPFVHNGKPCGFGFVDMATQEAGHKAILMFNGRNLDGHHLTVKEDIPQSKGHFGIRALKNR
jgi:RNA recognition motif-containing protein